MNDQQSGENDFLFRVKNGHIPSCGTPPSIDGNTPGCRYSYFQNEHGEQAIFEYNLETKTARVWMGDAGWERSFEVINGVPPELVVAPSEALWIGACWLAATGELPQPPNRDED